MPVPAHRLTDRSQGLDVLGVLRPRQRPVDEEPTGGVGGGAEWPDPGFARPGRAAGTGAHRALRGAGGRARHGRHAGRSPQDGQCGLSRRGRNAADPAGGRGGRVGPSGWTRALAPRRRSGGRGERRRAAGPRVGRGGAAWTAWAASTCPAAVPPTCPSADPPVGVAVRSARCPPLTRHDLVARRGRRHGAPRPGAALRRARPFVHRRGAAGRRRVGRRRPRASRARDVVSWQLPTVAESVVLMLALARVGATQNPIIPILREREVGHIVGCVGTTKMIVPETWRGLRPRRPRPPTRRGQRLRDDRRRPGG